MEPPVARGGKMTRRAVAARGRIARDSSMTAIHYARGPCKSPLISLNAEARIRNGAPHAQVRAAARVSRVQRGARWTDLPKESGPDRGRSCKHEQRPRGRYSDGVRNGLSTLAPEGGRVHAAPPG